VAPKSDAARDAIDCNVEGKRHWRGNGEACVFSRYSL
jgi:hypothetical protein